MHLHANELFEGYFRALAELGAISHYSGYQYGLWTKLATAALVQVGLRAFPEGTKVAKNHRDSFGRSEYLALDVAILDPTTWGPPLFVAEHENSMLKARAQYDAWKLLSVDSRRRVLVAYFGGKECPTFDALKDAVAEVCQDNPGKDILLIGGDNGAVPKTLDELRAAHQTAIVGVPLR
jgi:hypothetical protein